MSINVNSTAALLGAFGVLDRARPVLLTLFFRMMQTFETEEVYFDRVQRARRLAPLVVPTVEGKPDRSRGYQTLGFKPPYLKPKHPIEPIKALKRVAGERLLGDLSPKQRFDLALLDNMLIEDDEITRFEEWMASQILRTGAVSCKSDNHPEVYVDLQRNPLHTTALTGALRWGQTGVDPLQNLRSWATTVQNNSGFHPGVVVMDPLAADLFINAPGVLRVMNAFRQTSGNVDLAGKVAGGALGEEVQYLGTIGQFDIFVYQQIYTDAAGATQKMMPDYTVIMGSPTGCGGVRTYGAVIDADAIDGAPDDGSAVNRVAMSRFPKVWKNKDPGVWFSMTQSAPLPLLGWADATFCATVN
ncbi:major capsid protein [Methylobacterium oryzihabitans]|uniref:Major capsid protein n=1 Tax=Methylobacterium oryzihabitans TaxID=2499852 RepID=A0A437NTA9_9HYPH|nr:major capsid protein [Methylobacterium oryzihabitans]RVU13158.1 major capsid protein [Methylobacterium oryzihabitans]